MAYVWQNEGWPNFTYSVNEINRAYCDYLYQKGLSDAIFSSMPAASQSIAHAEAVSTETVYSSAIEGENLSYDSVFSSVLKHLDVKLETKAKVDKVSENVSRLTIDALSGKEALSHERLFYWHHLLFDAMPKAKRPKVVGGYRKEPIYVIHHTGKGDVEVLYEAVNAGRIDSEMEQFLDWVNSENEPRAIVKSAIASFWFVTIHPFSDGNGRISRAISDCILARMDGNPIHYYSMSSAIKRDRRTYYEKLQKDQSNEDLDITEWIIWFIDTATKALKDAEVTFRKKSRTSEIMHLLNPADFNSRQMFMLYRLIDGSFFGNLNQSKWMKMTKCQTATATRDLSELAERMILIRLGSSPKTTIYVLNPNLETILKSAPDNV